MKFVFITIFCFLITLNCFAQIDEMPKVPLKVGIEQIYLAKDNGEGNAGDEAEGFFTSDIPIYCVVRLTSTKKATVKMDFVAVSVKGVKPESTVFTTSYTTNGNQDQVYFTGKPGGKSWVAGNYRIDIFLDGKLVGNKAFTIQHSPAQNSVPTNFTTPKPKPKTTKRARKI
jgi:hypothetical protein